MAVRQSRPFRALTRARHHRHWHDGYPHGSGGISARSGAQMHLWQDFQVIFGNDPPQEDLSQRQMNHPLPKRTRLRSKYQTIEIINYDSYDGIYDVWDILDSGDRFRDTIGSYVLDYHWQIVNGFNRVLDELG
jgi:hypothetical protein